jgi:hypothetical protein
MAERCEVLKHYTEEAAKGERTVSVKKGGVEAARAKVIEAAVLVQPASRTTRRGNMCSTYSSSITGFLLQKSFFQCSLSFTGDAATRGTKEKEPQKRVEGTRCKS